jgi:hypothetical protein
MDRKLTDGPHWLTDLLESFQQRSGTGRKAEDEFFGGLRGPARVNPGLSARGLGPASVVHSTDAFPESNKLICGHTLESLVQAVGPEDFHVG